MWITGQVVDHRGWVLPGVTVIASAPGHDDRRVLMTDARGVYAITSLAPGRYDLTFSRDGFRTISRAVSETGFVAIVDVGLVPGD
jgi:hypothetical protein